MIQEFQYKVTEDESRARQKPIWIGLEQNAPGHEHVSMAVLQGQQNADDPVQGRQRVTHAHSHPHRYTARLGGEVA